MPRTFHRNRNAEPEKKEESKDEKSRTFRKQIVRQEGNSSELIHKRNKSNLSPSKMKEEIKISKKEIKEEKVIENKTENENKIKIQNFKVKVKRPNFTEDEILQMKNDFNELDILNEGKINPGSMLIFINKNDNFKNKSPFYFEALQNLNDKNNNINGINVDQFIDEVKKVINDNYDRENNFDNWKKIFQIYFLDKGGKIINDDILINTIKELGFEVSDDEIKNLIEKIGGDIDEKKFISIMKTIEKK